MVEKGGDRNDYYAVQLDDYGLKSLVASTKKMYQYHRHQKLLHSMNGNLRTGNEYVTKL